MATTSYDVDTSWYTNIGATDHITGDLDTLTVKEPYHGNDRVHTANGSGMMIKHIGDTSVFTPARPLHLIKPCTSCSSCH